MGILCEVVAAAPPSREVLSKVEHFAPWLESQTRRHFLDTWGMFLHYLLTGSYRGGRPPLSFLYERGWGKEAPGVGGVDWMYDAPMIYSAEKTSEIASKFRRIRRDEATMRERCDIESLSRRQIYPFVGWTADQAPPRLFEDALANLHTLRTFVTEAAERGDACIVRYY